MDVQPLLHPHLTSSKTALGVGSSVVIIGMYLLETIFHPFSVISGSAGKFNV